MTKSRKKIEAKLKESGDWDEMSESEKEKATAVAKSGCLHHLRNLVIVWGAKAEVARMKTELAADLEEIHR